MKAEKRAIRQALRARRRHLPAATVEVASAAVCARLRTLPEYRAAVSVIAYVAAENEVSVASLFGDIVRGHRRIYLPRTNTGVALVRWQPSEALVAGSGGILEPADGVPAVPELPALALIPIVAWDERGTRLGRGGGFYDRLLAQLAPAIIRVGLAYEFQLVHELPHEAWDIPLDYVTTEQRIVRCGRGEAIVSGLLQKGGLHPS